MRSKRKRRLFSRTQSESMRTLLTSGFSPAAEAALGSERWRRRPRQLFLIASSGSGHMVFIYIITR